MEVWLIQSDTGCINSASTYYYADNQYIIMYINMVLITCQVDILITFNEQNMMITVWIPLKKLLVNRYIKSRRIICIFHLLSGLYIKTDTPNFIPGFSAEVFQHLSTRFSKALQGVYKKTSGRSHDCPDIFLNLKNLILWKNKFNTYFFLLLL